jgi:hypothetical protein
MATGRRTSSTVSLSLATVVATTAGGATGVAFSDPLSPVATTALVIGLGVISLIGIAMVNLGKQTRVSGRLAPQAGHPPVPDRRASDPRRAAHPRPPDPQPTSVDNTPGPAPNSHISVALPLPSQWWTQEPRVTASQTRPPQHATPVAAPDLESYLASSLLAQCPQCGSFDLAATAAPPGYDFVCRACDHPWRWQSGQPWPAMRVSPRLRRPRSPFAV